MRAACVAIQRVAAECAAIEDRLADGFTNNGSRGNIAHRTSRNQREKQTLGGPAHLPLGCVDGGTLTIGVAELQNANFFLDV